MAFCFDSAVSFVGFMGINMSSQILRSIFAYVKGLIYMFDAFSRIWCWSWKYLLKITMRYCFKQNLLFWGSCCNSDVKLIRRCDFTWPWLWTIWKWVSGTITTILCVWMHLLQWQSYSSRTVLVSFMELFCISFCYQYFRSSRQSCFLLFLKYRGLCLTVSSCCWEYLLPYLMVWLSSCCLSLGLLD